MFAKFFIDRPIVAWVIALIILLGGALALNNLPIAQYPSVAPPALSIGVTYPGASAQVIEETSVALLEQEMNGIEHLLYMESSSELGSGSVTLLPGARAGPERESNSRVDVRGTNLPAAAALAGTKAPTTSTTTCVGTNVNTRNVPDESTRVIEPFARIWPASKFTFETSGRP